MTRSRAVALAAVLSAAIVSAPEMSADAVVRAGTAFILNVPESGEWTIGAHGTTLTMVVNANQDFRVARLATWSGETHALGSLPDSQITAGGKTVPFGNRAAGFVFRSVSTSVSGSTVRLDVTYDLPPARLRATRHYGATSGSPTFETWTTFTPLGSPVALSNLTPLTLTIPPGTLHLVNGLQGDDATTARDTAFTRQQRTLEPGERLSLGAPGRSSEQTVPWIAADSGADVFYSGLLWSGAWSLTAERNAAGIGLTLGLGSMTTTASSTIDGPHAFFGVVRGGVDAASAALRSFIVNGLRGGRAFDPLVTYNTWYAYGAAIDEKSMRDEIDGAAALGAELFVLDAGWYPGAGRGGAGDF